METEGRAMIERLDDGHEIENHGTSLFIHCVTGSGIKIATRPPHCPMCGAELPE